jgi:hypothetical protein
MSFPYPYFQIQFTKDGNRFLPSETDALLAGIAGAPNAPTDLFVLSHGWNDNMTEATALYTDLANVFKTQIDATPALASRRFAICGVLWPSKKFEERDLIPGGAASIENGISDNDLKARVAGLKALVTGMGWESGGHEAEPGFDELAALMDDVEDDESQQHKAIDLLRSLLPQQHKNSEDGSDHFFGLTSSSLLQKLSKSQTKTTAGGAASFVDVLGGIKAAILRALNFATYYTMKGRAGDVGVHGVAPLIVKIRDARPDLRIHMVGHSFGCRLTAAAVNALPDGDKYRPDTLLLLQGAFSHNGFAVEGEQTDRGAFRDVIEKKKVRGPILISYSINDKAVGIAYPLASRLNGVTAAVLGDANDIFGGLGSNGTQTKDTTPERVMVTMLPVGGVYDFAIGIKSSVPYNFRADDFIKDHSDIVKPEVAWVLTVGLTAPLALSA